MHLQHTCPTLRRLAVVVRVLAIGGAMALVAVPMWFWFSPQWLAWHAPQMAGTPHVTIGPHTPLLGLAVSAVPVAVGLFTLWQLWRLFGEYAAGRVFSHAAQLWLRRFAWGVLGAALLAPAVRAALSLVLTLHNPVGQRMLTLSIRWDDYMYTLVGSVLLAIATVMTEAARAAEENAQFV